jgi:hypothetical protein
VTDGLPSPAPAQLVVLGMHRSGTSGVTRLLNLAGAYFGPPRAAATEANEENPKGLLGAARRAGNVCDGLLHGAGFDWWTGSTGFDVGRPAGRPCPDGAGLGPRSPTMLDRARTPTARGW